MGHGLRKMSMSRMEQFTQAYRNLSQFPLYSQTDVEKFRVAYGQATLGLLRRKILAIEDDGKLIFTGHRGCGKSTLLGQLAEKMRQEGLFVAGFSIASMVELSDVNHINILYSIALQLLEQACDKEVPIAEETETKLLTWFTQVKSRVYVEQLKQEMSVGANIFDFFKAKLQREGAFREEIKETFENKVSDLSQQIDLIAGEIQAATKKSVLVIIDDLDKLDLPVIRSVFRDNIHALLSPSIRVLFTIPIAVVREPGLMAMLDPERTVLLGVPKFFSKAIAHQPNPTPIEANVAVLQKVLEKRIPEDLIESDVKRQIVLLSGGVLREMVRLARECCMECMVQMDEDPEVTDIRINADILAKAVKSIRQSICAGAGKRSIRFVGANVSRVCAAGCQEQRVFGNAARAVCVGV